MDAATVAARYAFANLHLFTMQWSGIPYGDVAIQSAMKMIYNIAPPAHITAKNEEPRLPCVCLAKPKF